MWRMSMSPVRCIQFILISVKLVEHCQQLFQRYRVATRLLLLKYSPLRNFRANSIIPHLIIEKLNQYICSIEIRHSQISFCHSGKINTQFITQNNAWILSNLISFESLYHRILLIIYGFPMKPFYPYVE